jgi:hypothetical protein
MVYLSAHLPSILHASSTVGFLAVSDMILCQALSMPSNRFASAGSWLRMSLLLKIPSRYIHLRCTSSQA